MNPKAIIASVITSFVLSAITAIPLVNAEEYVPKAIVNKLYQAALPGVDGKEMTVVHITAPAGYIGGKHKHPGPVYVYVLKGELTVELEEGDKTFKAGEFYPEDINTAMTGKNLSTSDDFEILVFQVGDVGKPMMIKVE